jgi:hypothetical protein
MRRPPKGSRTESTYARNGPAGEYVHPLAKGNEFIRAFANQNAWPEGPTWVVL